MNIIRSERLILVKPVSLPEDSGRFYAPRSITTCDLPDLPQAASDAWQEGFFPLIVFEKANEIDKLNQNIPLSYSRWSAFAKDKEPERLVWLSAHPTLEVLRGLANRDLLALPDKDFHDSLNDWINKDATASSLLQQLRDGQIVPEELESIPTPSNQSAKKHFRACWQLDPRVTLDIVYTYNQIIITAQAEEAPLPKSLGEFGDVRNFVVNNLVLDCQKDKSLIQSLSYILPKPIPPSPNILKDLFGRLVEVFIDQFDSLGAFQSAFAAGTEEKTDLELFLSSCDGAEWHLCTMVDQDDPSQKSIQLFCNSAGYEGA